MRMYFLCVCGFWLVYSAMWDRVRVHVCVWGVTRYLVVGGKWGARVLRAFAVIVKRKGTCTLYRQPPLGLSWRSLQTACVLRFLCKFAYVWNTLT
jgi:hypothetical protein